MSSSETTTSDIQTTTTITMQDEQQQSTEALTEKLDKMKISASFTIWPPTQRTRDAVTTRLIETLSTPSVLSKRYGTVSPEDASAIAKSIEEDAFLAASSAPPPPSQDSVDGGIEILQVYSKEISKRVLDSVKSRSSDLGKDQTAADVDVGSGVGAQDSVAVTEEEEENESSSA